MGKTQWGERKRQMLEEKETQHAPSTPCAFLRFLNAFSVGVRFGLEMPTETDGFLLSIRFFSVFVVVF